MCEHLTQKHSESVEDTTYERGIFYAFPVKPFQMFANSLPCSPAEVLLHCAPADQLLGNPAKALLHCAPAGQLFGNPAEALLPCAPANQLLGNRSLAKDQQPMKYLLPGMRERSLVVT